MRKSETTLICPKLTTIEDYVKQREKSRSDFQNFMEKRNANNGNCFSIENEKKRM